GRRRTPASGRPGPTWRRKSRRKTTARAGHCTVRGAPGHRPAGQRAGSRQSLGVLGVRFDDVAERRKRLRPHDRNSISKERRSRADPDRLTLFEVLFYGLRIFVRLQIRGELLDVHPRILGDALEELVRHLTAVGLRLIGVYRVMKLPELALSGRRTSGLGALPGVISQIREVAPFDTHDALLDVLVDDFGCDVAG